MPIWPGVAKSLIRLGWAQRLASVKAVMGDSLPFLRYYSRRILGSPNVELQWTRRLLERTTATTVNLSSGAPHFDDHVNRVYRTEHSDHERYPPLEGLWELRNAVAEKLARENALDVNPNNQILVCNGVSHAINVFLDTFVDRSESVVVLDPCFFVYRLAAMNREIKIRPVPTWLEQGLLRFRERDLRRVLRSAKAMFVNTPANPSGGVLSPESLERIAYWCNRYDVLLFSDEVYERYQYSGRHVSVGCLKDAAHRTITANSLSKSHALAGIRIGYAAGSPHLIKPMSVSMLATAPFISTPAQLMALSAVGQPCEHFTPVLNEFKRRREAVGEFFSEAGLLDELPGGAFYFWLPVHRLGVSGREFTQQLLDEQQVLVTAGESCGTSGKGFVRLSYAGDWSALKLGLSRIYDHISQRYPERASQKLEELAGRLSPTSRQAA